MDIMVACTLIQHYNVTQLGVCDGTCTIVYVGVMRWYLCVCKSGLMVLVRSVYVRR